MTSSHLSTSNTVQRQVAGGTIICEAKNGLLYARGIRYANANRFEAPQRPKPWTEPLNCTQPGNVCPQLPSRLAAVIGDVLVDRSMNEDCFFLSVTAPLSPKAPDKLPVMVWFHGGAYMSGGGDLIPYDPSALVRRGVVVVNVNYRLGIFGAQEILGIAPPNLGLQDQIMALHWVQENISYLGGDPSNVTIFGQSAGADSCYCLLAADGTDHLFQRAIMQSPPWASRAAMPRITQTTKKIAQEALKDKSLSTISTEELLKIQAHIAQTTTNLPNELLAFAPTFNAHPLPSEQQLAARLAQISRTKPIMLGWTAQDSLPFTNPTPLANYPRNLPILNHLVNLYTWHSTRLQFKTPSLHFHQTWLKNGGSSTTYSFDYHPPGNQLKAAHCIDLAFLLGDWQYWDTTPVMQGIDRVVFDRLSDAVKDTWVAFAKGHRFGDGHLYINEGFTGI